MPVAGDALQVGSYRLRELGGIGGRVICTRTLPPPQFIGIRLRPFRKDIFPFEQTADGIDHSVVVESVLHISMLLSLQGRITDAECTEDNREYSVLRCMEHEVREGCRRHFPSPLIWHE